MDSKFKKSKLNKRIENAMPKDQDIEKIKAELENTANEIPKADFVEQTDKKSVGQRIHNLNTKENENISKRQNNLKKAITILFIVFVVGVLAFTAYNDFFARGDKGLTWEQIMGVINYGWIYLLCALLALVFCYLFKGLKLSVICKPLTGKFHFKTCLETATIGHYYNSVTPLAVGGQPFEIYHLSKHGIHGGVASSLPIATYVLNQFAFVIAGLVFVIMFKFNALGITPTLANAFPPAFEVLAFIGLGLCMLMPLLVIVFSLMPKFGSKVVYFVMHIGGKLRIVKDPKGTSYKTVKNLIHNAQCLKKIFKTPIAALLCFFMSFIEHLANASIAYFSLKAFGFPTFVNPVSPLMEFVQVIQLVFMLNCAISFVPTPGNAGAADLSFYLLFQVGLGAGFAFPAMTVWRVISFYSYIIIGFIFATLKKRSDRKNPVEFQPLE